MMRALILLLLLNSPVLAADIDARLTTKRAAQMLDRAALALSDAQTATDRVAALTETVKAYEEGLLALREDLRQIAVHERALRVTLDQKSEEIARLLGVLQTIQTAPAPVLLLHPQGPEGTVRSAMMISAVTPGLQAEVDRLKTDLNEVQLLRLIQEDAVARLTTGLDGAQTARIDLNRAIAERRTLPKRFEADEIAMTILLESSDTLDGFADGLSQFDKSASDVIIAFETAKGGLDLPVQGRLLRGFRESDAAGVRRPGLLIATEARALVTTPWPATIRYAGPLLDHGNVMILEPEQGYLLVIAGLNDVYGEVGEILDQGAPIGLMGGTEQSRDLLLTAAREGSSVTRNETLYIELRQGDAPVDPTAWFKLTKE